MARYRKKPVVIEAMQYTGGNHDEIDTFMGRGEHDELNRRFISTLEGRMLVSPGDWVIRGVQGELYPCKPEIFDATYEKA